MLLSAVHPVAVLSVTFYYLYFGNFAIWLISVCFSSFVNFAYFFFCIASMLIVCHLLVEREAKNFGMLTICVRALLMCSVPFVFLPPYIQ